MSEYSEQDLKYAAEFREGIHREALAIVRKTRPEITDVIDRHPVEDYFQEIWDYPGKWYTIVAVPYGYGSRGALVDAIVRDTLSGGVPNPESAPHAQEPRKEAKSERSRRDLTDRLDAKPDGCREFFTVEVDRENRRFRAVGVDPEGRYILEQYEEYDLGGAVGSRGAYYVLTDLQYRRYARTALLNGYLREEDYDRLTAGQTKAPKRENDPFYSLLDEYPDLVVDYCIVWDDRYCGYGSHRGALKTAFGRLRGGWNGDPARAVGKSVPADGMFSSDDRSGKLNYRKAFLYPPHGNGYSGSDFARVNAALFPNGTDALEVFEWSTDWSDYFDDGHEWWGALCLTVYDKTLGRFVVIMASATD